MFRWNGLAFLHSFQHFMTILLNISGNKNYVHKYFTTLKCPPFLIIISSCRLRHNKQGRRQVSFDINKWQAMSDELAAVSRVTCHAAAVMCNVAPLGAAQWAAVDRRPHGVSIAAHCALLIVSPHTTTRTSADRWLQPGSSSKRWCRQSKKF